MKQITRFNISIYLAILLGLGVYWAMISHNSHKNHLTVEKSPYLQQHAQNPVWWYPWSTKAFEQAQKENKPVFLSIGYSTCHWCHVMAHESFEDKEVADLLNQYFVSIKVDREERPDVDAIYMDAAQAMTGTGGWPLSVFLTPQGQPFLAGTYFPKIHFMELLQKIHGAWGKDREKIFESAEALTQILKTPPPSSSASWSENVFKQFFQHWESSFDWTHGGKTAQLKFPPPYELRVLLRYHLQSKSENALKMVAFTLNKMSQGGIYDHMGGGFHRYATDPKWLVPHFEKMLYDQASMALTYLEAFQLTQEKEYELVAREILDYVLREMTHQEGGFYSAEDADSEGEEGTFYIWKEEELKKSLTEEEFQALKKDFNLGNFHQNTHILELDPLASRKNRSETLKSALKKLFDIRNKRIHPHKDTKILTSWNALMISTLARATQILDDSRYREAAQKSAQFVLHYLFDKEGNLHRRWIDGEAKENAVLDDYAFLIDALLQLYQTDFNSQWLTLAKTFQKKQDELFLDTFNGNYFLTDGRDSTLIHRSKELMDNVQPAGNSMAALNLLRLAGYFLEENYRQKSEKLFNSIPDKLKNIPQAFPQLLMALNYEKTSQEIAIIAPEISLALPPVRQLQKQLTRAQILAVGLPDSKDIPLLAHRTCLNNQVTFYVCEKGRCFQPTTDLKSLTNPLN